MDEVVISEGMCSFSYTIDENVNSFVFERRTIQYYHGNVVFINGEQAGVDVTFIVQDRDHLEDVKSRFLNELKTNHNRVMRPYFYTRDDNRVLICYDKIQCFLTEYDGTKQVKESNGQPNEITAIDIRELSMGLEELHKMGLTCSKLQYSSSYVISKGKIKFCNIDVEKDSSFNDGQWDTLLLPNIKKFEMLIKSLLNTSDDWPERDSFMKCFKQLINKRSCRDLRVIYTHPFLMRNIKYAVQILANAHHAVCSQDYGDLNYTNLEQKLNGQQLNIEFQFQEREGWLRNITNCDFLEILSYDPTSRASSSRGTSRASSSRGSHQQTRLGRSRPLPPPQPYFPGQPPSHANIDPINIRYNTNDTKDLLRFLRNVYQHYYTNMTLNDVHDEIKKQWPRLIDRIHVLSRC